jgi:hypothetical protein
MKVEHGSREVPHLGGRGVDRGADLLLARLSRRVPRRRRRKPDGDHRVHVVELHDSALARDDALAVGLIQGVEHRRRVVVATREIHTHRRAAKTLLRELQPLVEPFARELLHETLDEQRIGAEPLVVVGVHHLPVEAGDLDAASEVLDRRPRVQRVSAAVELGVHRAVPPNDRHERLAHEVAAEDERVDLVEGGGIDELPPRRLRTVQVRGEEQPDPVSLAPTRHATTPTKRRRRSSSAR